MSQVGNLAGKPYATWGATSAAAPHVAGVAALIFQKKPNLALADLVKQLEAKARPAPPKEQFGEGKVDAKKSRDAV
jgi:subtilisin family serine protease